MTTIRGPGGPGHLWEAPVGAGSPGGTHAWARLGLEAQRKGRDGRQGVKPGPGPPQPPVGVSRLCLSSSLAGEIISASGYFLSPLRGGSGTLARPWELPSALQGRGIDGPSQGTLGLPRTPNPREDWGRLFQTADLTAPPPATGPEPGPLGLSHRLARTLSPAHRLWARTPGSARVPGPPDPAQSLLSMTQGPGVSFSRGWAPRFGEGPVTFRLPPLGGCCPWRSPGPPAG